MLEQITVNLTTGAIAYPHVEGFELDKAEVGRTLDMFLPHCGGDVAQAIKLAIHQQLAAYRGAATLRGSK